MQPIYFISGLGADERVFQYLQINGCEPHYIHWIAPLEKESIGHYAQRLLSQINDPNPILIGLSFGGMIAVEISKLIPVKKIILISSAKNKYEIPPYFHLLKFVKVHQWLPYSWLKKLGIILGNWLFGTENKSTCALLRSIIRDTDEKFFRWAWEKVITWKNASAPSNTIHIHGTKDNMLPIRYVQADYRIQGGTHLMIVNYANEISNLLQQVLREENIK